MSPRQHARWLPASVRRKGAFQVKSIVIYTSHFGNTRAIAEAIAEGLRMRGAARVLSVEEVGSTLPERADLVVIGGPTEAHGMTPPLTEWLGRLEPDALRGMVAVGFDTRLRWPRWLSGSAGYDITEKLRQAGARVIAPAESFFIKGIAGTGGSKTATLQDGELERAAAWGVSLADRLELAAPAAPGGAR
jgi:flavodoxin